MQGEREDGRDGLSLDLAVQAGDWPPEEELAELGRAALAAAAAVASRPTAGGAGGQPAGEVSLLFTDDAGIRVLNARYRGKDKATNVLSFPQSGGPLLGDIVLAFETVAAEAALADKPLKAHMGHLIVHGFLHLLGYDHEGDGEAEEMEALERAALERMGLPDPYAPA